MSRFCSFQRLLSAPGILLSALATGALAQPTDAGEGKTEIGVVYFHERLTQREEEWTEKQIGMLHRFADRTSLFGRMIEAERSGLRDRVLSLSAYYPIAARTTAFAEIAASDPHRFLPRDLAHVQLAQSFADGWGAMVGWKHLRYDTTDVDLADLTLEKYFSDYRAAFTVFPSYSSGAGNATSYRFQLGYYPDAENRLRLSLAKGIEVERPSEFNPVIATPLRSVVLDGRRWLSRDWGFTWALGRTLQEAVTRNLAGLGLLYRF